MYDLKSLVRPLFDRDVHSEMGLAVAYSIPAAVGFITALQGDSDLFDYLSGTAQSTWQDVYPHSLFSAALTGFTSKMIEKYAPRLRKYGKLIGAAASLTFMVPVWESYEKTVDLPDGGDYAKDIISDVSGILSYVGVSRLREKLDGRLKGGQKV